MAFDNFREDIRVFNWKHRDKNRWLSYLYFPGFRTLLLIRFSRWCFTHHLSPIAYLIVMINEVLSGVWVGPNVQIGKGLFLGHARGLVMNPHVKIGDYCSFVQQVGLGGPSVTVGSYVGFSAGCKVISTYNRPIVIGNFVIIGAGAVVINDIPDGSVVAGVPARVIRKITPQEIETYWGAFLDPEKIPSKLEDIKEHFCGNFHERES